MLELQRDFLDDDLDATDPGTSGLGDNPGHGTATLALLAGRRVHPQGGPALDDFLGGAPHAEVVPIRIADSVIHFSSSTMAEGIEYAITSGCRAISISMGGLPARRWAHAVNAAYEAGVAIFAAAGNNIRDGFPTRETVWPARFTRVVGVCGATADKSPYFKSAFNGMQDNFGPEHKMDTAIAAYTPNAPWAEMGCSDVVSMNGGGTSAATPQVAAAATLWCQHQTSPTNIERWQRAEAVRHALFSSADKRPPNRFKFFGQGLLRARRSGCAVRHLAAQGPEGQRMVPSTQPADGVRRAIRRSQADARGRSGATGRLEPGDNRGAARSRRAAGPDSAR